MISAYWIILFSAVIGVLIGWIMSDKTDIEEVRKVCKRWEKYYWEEVGKTIEAYKEIHKRNEDIKELNRLLENANKKLNPQPPKEPHKMTIDVELNTDLLQSEMDRLKKIIGICKHQDTCTFFEIGEDSHISHEI